MFNRNCEFDLNNVCRWLWYCILFIRMSQSKKIITHGAMLAYQFAHEYCHHLIDEPMDGESCTSFWFEESICELSPVYFMRRIAQRWIEENTPILIDYVAAVAISKKNDHKRNM